MRHGIGVLWVGMLASGLAAASAAPPVLVVPASKAPLHIAIDVPQDVSLTATGPCRLVDLEGKASLPAQLVPQLAEDGTAGRGGGRLLADLPASPHGPRRFRLEAGAADEARAKGFRFSDVDEKSLRISEGDKPVLVYNHGILTNEKVPAKDNRRSRGCYVHPVWGLDGEVLTDDFPADHYHHHGIFWAWPHVGLRGQQYSLWTHDKITPKFVAWIHRQAGPVAAVLAVENGWYVGSKRVMIERLWLRTGQAVDDQRPLDFEFTWIPVDEPITLRGAEGKSYGGLTMRFAVPKGKTPVITVPQGQPKEDLPEMPLPWADLSMKFDGRATSSGAAIFIPRSHPDYPPTWLTRHYGPLCVGWPGVKDRTFEPGKPIRLSYRVWVHRDAGTVPMLTQAYEAYLTQATWER